MASILGERADLIPKYVDKQLGANISRYKLFKVEVLVSILSRHLEQQIFIVLQLPIHFIHEISTAKTSNRCLKKKF